MSRWRGTRLCEPLFVEGSGSSATPWSRRRGAGDNTRWDEPAPRETKLKGTGNHYKLDLENGVLTLKIHGGKEVKLKLLTSPERVGKFRGWSNYEVAVRVVENEVYVAVYFKRRVELRRPRTVMTVNINFDNITLAVFTPSGRMLRLKRIKTPLRRILTHRIWIERIQKRYLRSLRFTKGIREFIRKHGERIRSIAWDYAHKVSDRLAELASEYGAVIVLENLNHLRDNAKKGSGFNKRLSLWFYRRIQFTIAYKALERGLEVEHVSPRKTSSIYPKCGGKLRGSGSRILYCPTCGFTGDRDVVSCINLFLRYSKCGVPGVAPNAPKSGKTPSGMQGKQG